MSDYPIRTAVVTGGAQGIGAAIAKRLAERGCRVAVVDLLEKAAVETASSISAAGATSLGVAADVSDEDQVSAAFDKIASELGPVHILVNNAGVLRDNLLFKMTVEDWDTVMNVHLRGAFLCSRAAQKQMVDEGFGRIVTMSSTSALGNRGQANYSAAKSGLQGLTKTLALELGPFGITANSVAPGFIETAMTKATAERMGGTIEQMRAEISASVPVRRGGVPNDIANAVDFLTSDDAGYVTGQVLYVDGGHSLL